MKPLTIHIGGNYNCRCNVQHRCVTAIILRKALERANSAGDALFRVKCSGRSSCDFSSVDTTCTMLSSEIRSAIITVNTLGNFPKKEV